MNRPQPVKIVLGDDFFVIKPLTIAQVVDIEPLLDGAAGGIKAKDALAVLKVALSRDHADVKIEELEATPRELFDSVTAILKLMAPDGAEPGEAPAAAETASTGATSTAA